MLRPKTLCLLLSLALLPACSYEPAYIAREKSPPSFWTKIFGSKEETEDRWAVGSLANAELNADERGIFDRWGAPNVIIFFRSLQGRKPVYEWVYENPFRNAWFVERKRVDYVPVDPETSPFGYHTRKIGNRVFVIGGIVVAIVGIVAIG